MSDYLKYGNIHPRTLLADLGPGDVFNPVSQGKKLDPDGDYVRRYVPELRGLTGAAIHEPWSLPAPPPDYPAPIVDHQQERAEALARYQAVRGR